MQIPQSPLGPPFKIETAQPTALVVDDNDIDRAYYAAVLKHGGYRVETVLNGFEALTLLEAQHFDVVVAEVNTPKVSGVEVLQWLVAYRPTTRVIILTRFSWLLKTASAQQLGCSAFLIKPVAGENLLAACRTERVVPSETTNLEYGSLSLDFFKGQKKLASSLFLRLKTGRFLKVAHEGDILDEARIADMQSRGVFDLWLPRAGFQFYMNEAHEALKKALAVNNIDGLKRAALARRICEMAAENVRLTGVSSQSIEAAQTTMVAAMEFLLRDPSAPAVLAMMESASPSVYAHSAMTALFCSLVANVMGWATEKNLFILTLGGFFHDLGLSLLPPEYGQNLATNEHTLDEEQKAVFETHPAVGVQALGVLETLPEEIRVIVGQHHENPRGTGYPSKMIRTDIFPMARIVGLVESFCDLLVKLEPKYRKQAPEFLRGMVAKDPNFFDADAVLALSLSFSEPDLAKARSEYERQCLKANQKATLNAR